MTSLAIESLGLFNPAGSRRKLYPHQIVAVDFLAKRRSALLADDMGTGKSATTICGADEIGAHKILVLCQAIARPMWQREWAKWQERVRAIQVIRAATDLKTIYGDAIIVSYDLATRCREQLCKLSWDLIVVDECQALKNLKAARTNAVYGKAGLITRTKRIWLLSGTPMPNNAAEIYPHYRGLGWGTLDYARFEQRFCLVRETPYGRQILGNNLARMPELAEILRPHMLQRRLSDVLKDMPPLHYDRYPVSPDKLPPRPELPPEVQAIIDRVETNAALEDGEIDYESWLAQISDEHLTTLRRWTGTAKAPLVAELVRNELEARDKIVVFGVFRDTLETIAKSLGPDAAIINGSTSQNERQRLIDSFQTGIRPRALVLQIHTAGTSLTLHRASRVIFAETTFTPADVVQAARRLHRIGQHSPVYASIVALAGSVDDVIAGIVLRKANEIAQLENLVAGRAA